MDQAQQLKLLEQIREQVDNAYDRAPTDRYNTSLLLALYKILSYLEADAARR